MSPTTANPLSVGIDLVEIERIGEILREYGDRFLQRYFTAEEREYCLSQRRPAQHVAARWAAKEAFVKAARDAGWESARMGDASLAKNADGSVRLRLSARAASALGQRVWSVSLTHTDRTAGAVVISARS